MVRRARLRTHSRCRGTAAAARAALVSHRPAAGEPKLSHSWLDAHAGKLIDRTRLATIRGRRFQLPAACGETQSGSACRRGAHSGRFAPPWSAARLRPGSGIPATAVRNWVAELELTGNCYAVRRCEDARTLAFPPGGGGDLPAFSGQYANSEI